MRYYIIAGEASGDLHGSNLIRAIRERDTEAEFRCWGGDLMLREGATLVRHIRDLAFMGFAEVVKHLPEILRNLRLCKADILNWKPHVVVLIDYPGFNFRLLEFLQRNNFKIVYYISPQLWAWKKGRVKKVKRFVNRMLVIFPFEKAFYEQNGVAAEYVGHPLLDVIHTADAMQAKDENLVALVPGSRRHEIAHLLPEYLRVVKHFPDKKFVVTGMSTIGEDFYHRIIRDYPVELVIDQTYPTLRRAAAALVTSGTATLEAALHNIPQVVCYKGSWISYFLAHLLIDKSIGHICIVNLICGKRIVTELIQHQVNETTLTNELRKLFDYEHRNSILNEYRSLRGLLGEGGASQRAAASVVELAGCSTPT
ncbi:MAG: lipid-A-disaccharide synthase [Chitinophagales bacterium]|nr:lipid-A-disaccharide synthase [Chitinophagales bacterium]MDW8419718.1 lipid-A-disaccharide synthase [Chitinophagales bacterium]